MTVSPRARFWGGLTLVCIGLLIALSEVAIHFYGKVMGHKYDAGHMDLFVALVIGFVGMYILSPKGAKDGGQFLVNNTIRVIQVIRSGRRKTDIVNAVVEDEQGNTATIAVPPLETEVSIPEGVDTPKRRRSDEKGGTEVRRKLNPEEGGNGEVREDK